ncbi:uncharacterized protein MYCFIDRAFT_83022 [Pseudocercospora fijiensis CIRAD86]|uniref:BTB domain-containing protein n=1 Tax=Pseudocercospora fijiensis (strain CIRAD86) TaxID=383855 RepID=M3AK63_PSEFD|nr:uncharacterized protein MYCFIDRAFT_83022 [Pseudocercospora fijiensis CIRAD86]EME84971.1 hypothetical protein MYCFIDRAFT_83022 [Pseudocercospora fijiensis CIRAD86]
MRGVAPGRGAVAVAVAVAVAGGRARAYLPPRIETCRDFHHHTGIARSHLESCSMSGNREASAMVALPSTPDKRPSAEHFDSMIQIKVGTGSEMQTFDMYKGVLRFYSGYFRTAIENIENGRFAEAQDGAINLPDEEPEIFNLFRGWLYTRVLPKVEDPQSDSAWRILFKLWCFGDRRNIPLLQNEVLDRLALEGLTHRTTPMYSLQNISGVSHQRSRSNGASKHSGQEARNFKDDLLKYMLEKRPKFIPDEFEKSDMCEWHVHEEGVRCKV